MAVSTTASRFRTAGAVRNTTLGFGAARRRQITPAAGRALEMLGHAIEYLTDEFVHDGGRFSGQDGRIEAVQLLMGVNRQIYLACPEIPTMGERWRALLHLRSA
jgi:hypothetical protein